jgi:hypothetical protein
VSLWPALIHNLPIPIVPETGFLRLFLFFPFFRFFLRLPPSLGYFIAETGRERNPRLLLEVFAMKADCFLILLDSYSPVKINEETFLPASLATSSSIVISKYFHVAKSICAPSATASIFLYLCLQVKKRKKEKKGSIEGITFVQSSLQLAFAT